MKRIILVASIVIVLLIGVLVAIPFLVPEGVYRNQIEKAASNALGREVEVAGDVSISVFPGISASVENVSVANPEGFPSPNMIEAGALKGSVRLWPLFSRKVEISKIEFVDAKVDLVRLETGEVNWNFASPGSAEANNGDTGGGVQTSIEKFSLENASLTYSDLQTGTRYELSELNAETGIRSFDSPVDLKANGKFQGQTFSTKARLTTVAGLLDAQPADVDFEFDSDLGKTSFSGMFTNGESLSMDGKFTASAPQLAAVSDFLGLSLPVNLAPLGALQVEGSVSGTLPALKFNFDKLALNADGFSAGYNGIVDWNDQLSFDGTTNISARDAGGIAQQIGLAQPVLSALKQLNFSADISGSPEALLLQNTNFQTSSPALQASYKGTIGTAGAGKIDGDVSVNSEQFRYVLSQLGVEMPEGETLKAVNIEGRANGTFQNVLMNNGTFQLDDIRATGTIGADLSGSKPRLTASLDTDAIDLSPFLGEEAKSESTGTGWSDDPLDLNGLQVANADIQLRAKSIKVGAVTLTDADVASTLTNGRLNADLKAFNAFNGAWKGQMGVDASSSVPTFRFNMAAADVSAKNLLGAFAGFDRLAGDGAFSIDVTSSGTTIAQIVNKLSGTAGLDLEDGSLAGVNLGQLVRTAGTLTGQLASGQLTLASLGDVVSPQAQTDFTSFKTELAITDGIAQVQSLKLVNSVLDISGSGQLNLGGQSLDLKLTPSIDRAGQGTASTVKLNGIPIPLRISGSWAAPKFSPDFSGVSNALQASARQQALDAIAGKSNGQIGEIVSGVLGTRTETATPPDSDTAQEAEEPSTEEPDKPEEESADTIVRNALGSIFGPN